LEKSLVCITAYSNKFWKIKVQGNAFIVTYGKIGTKGSINTKEFASEELCLKEANKLIESKLKKGYRESEGEEEWVQISGISQNQFWELLAAAHKKGDDWEEQLEWLVEKLAKKPVIDIIQFDYHFNQNYYKSYTSDLWAAAYIIMGGCSDDSFDYFRAWLLFLGEEPYEKALQNPESIIPYLKGLEEEVPEFEEFLYCASMAFEEKMDLDQEDYLDLYWKLSGDEYEQPAMEFDWDEEDEEGLRKKFPQLWELYGNSPLG
jgi:predicted DNA-binding WGR domain protein